MNLYIDESGNAGNITSYEQYLKEQPVYTLCGVSFPEGRERSTESHLRNYLKDRGVDQCELKYTKMKRNRDLVESVMNFVYDSKMFIQVEVFPKNFLLAMQADQYLLHPVYENTPMSRQDAHYLYENLTAEESKDIFDLFGSSTIEEYEEKSRTIKEIFKRLGLNKFERVVSRNIDNGIAKHKNGTISLINLTPIPDFDNSGNRLISYHHIYCLHNILIQAKSRLGEFKLVHDELVKYKNHVEQVMSQQWDLTVNWGRSDEYLGLQVTAVRLT